MRVLFCSVPDPGHLHPQVGLARELRARGHQVAFATGLAARDTLRAAGLERLPRGEADGDSFALKTWFKAPQTAVDVEHVRYAVRCFAPDLLVTHQLCQAPLLVREMEQLPVAVMGLFSYLWSVRRPVVPARFAALEPTRRWRTADGTRFLDESRALLGLPPRDDDGASLLGDLFMLRTVAGLEPELEALPDRVHPVGPCLWEPEPAAGAWDALRRRFPDPDAPVIYAQQGRTFRSHGFWSQLVEALGGQPVQVVASTGRMDQPVGDLPPNFLAEPHVPQGLVMRHARAVVSLGTSTVALGALAHGLPSVLVPGGGETPDNADRMVAAGCALTLDGESLTAADLRATLDQVLADAEMRGRCRDVQALLARAAGFGAAAERVEGLAMAAAPRDVAAFAAD